MANLHLLINFTCYNNYLQIKSQEFSPSLNISCGIHVLCVCVCVCVCVCSGPPEKKMGIKASNTAEVRTHIHVQYVRT